MRDAIETLDKNMKSRFDDFLVWYFFCCPLSISNRPQYFEQ